MFLPFSKRASEWEPVGLELRQLSGLRSAERLDPWQLAPKVRLRVVDGDDALTLLALHEREHLLGFARDSWSGGVLPKQLPDGTYVCILNPTHSLRRNKITLMEEIVHTYCKHEPSVVSFNAAGLRCRHYDRPREEEAYGVGAAALLPWHKFFQQVNAGWMVEQLAEEYEVSEELVEYRIKITGMYRLFCARQRRRA